MMAGPETVSTTVRVADTITLVLSKYAFVGYALPVCQLVVVIDVILDDLTISCLLSLSLRVLVTWVPLMPCIK